MQLLLNDSFSAFAVQCAGAEVVLQRHSKTSASCFRTSSEIVRDRLDVIPRRVDTHDTHLIGFCRVESVIAALQSFYGSEGAAVCQQEYLATASCRSSYSIPLGQLQFVQRILTRQIDCFGHPGVTTLFSQQFSQRHTHTAPSTNICYVFGLNPDHLASMIFPCTEATCN